MMICVMCNCVGKKLVISPKKQMLFLYIFKHFYFDDLWWPSRFATFRTTEDGNCYINNYNDLLLNLLSNFYTECPRSRLQS